MSTYRNFRKSNRHSLDIVRDILVVASVKARKTRIMYQANLSFVQVKKYLRNLLEKKLLKCDGDSCYLITEKGLEFLKLYDEFTEKRRELNEKLSQNYRDKLLLERIAL